MSKPTELPLTGLKKLGRYLEGDRRLAFEHGYQSAEKVYVYTDNDWAGFVKT